MNSIGRLLWAIGGAGILYYVVDWKIALAVIGAAMIFGGLADGYSGPTGEGMGAMLDAHALFLAKEIREARSEFDALSKDLEEVKNALYSIGANTNPDRVKW